MILRQVDYDMTEEIKANAIAVSSSTTRPIMPFLSWFLRAHPASKESSISTSTKVIETEVRRGY
ncbi:hypothetical protein C2845_PM11G07130 [Panicum miliaceum]|uniref:Uncharacterized protein n=1 Tax=Panicum miliaceum TaxID=4540 RepID=A0A3L6RV24_PANMI|nr:hypothetical protein C2845_PM11G07130 [Panicum miliaceum]